MPVRFTRAFRVTSLFALLAFLLHVGGIASAMPMPVCAPMPAPMAGSMTMIMAQTSRAQPLAPAQQPAALCPCCAALAHLTLPAPASLPAGPVLVRHRPFVHQPRLMAFPAVPPIVPPPRQTRV